jgi:hypothetical protein
MMVVATLAIAGSVAAWLLFGGTDSDGAEVFSMPGSVTADLTEGDWALYSEEVGGSQHVAYPDDVTVDGPGEVEVEQTFGFYSDTTTIDVDGTAYTVFARLDVPEDGSYDVTIVDDTADGETPVVIGQYPNHDVLAIAIIVVVLGSMLIGAAGLVVLIVGLVMRTRGRRATAPAVEVTATAGGRSRCSRPSGSRRSSSADQRRS